MSILFLLSSLFMSKRLLPALLLPVLFLAACGKKQTVTVPGDSVIGSDVFHVVLPTDEQKKNPPHGQELWFAYGAVAGTKTGTPVSGIANAQYFKDGTFAVNAHINIPVPEKGTHYEGWVSNGSQKVNIGEFTSPTADVRMGLSFEVKKDLRSSTKVLVTLEKDNDQATEGEIIAEGTVKYYKR